MKNTIQKIQEVQNYFKQKLISGDYTLENISNNVVTEVLIDDKFKFSIWTNIKAFSQYVSSYNNFIILPNFTEEEEKDARKNIEPRLKEYKATILLKEKEEKLQKLTSEIELIKSA